MTFEMNTNPGESEEGEGVRGEEGEEGKKKIIKEQTIVMGNLTRVKIVVSSFYNA